MGIEFKSMKRFRRWLFTIAVVASLLLCVTGAALWVRSYFAHETLGIVHEDWTDAAHWRFRSVSMTFYDGSFFFGAGETLNDFTRAATIPTVAGNEDASAFRRRHPGETRGVWRPVPVGPNIVSPTTWHGFMFEHETVVMFSGASTQRTIAVGTPAWFVLILAMVLPGIWLWRRRVESKLKREGVCLTCGYDLRATPDRCPECGTISAGTN